MLSRSTRPVPAAKYVVLVAVASLVVMILSPRNHHREHNGLDIGVGERLLVWFVADVGRLFRQGRVEDNLRLRNRKEAREVIPVASELRKT